MTSAGLKGILSTMSHHSSVYSKLLRNQRIFLDNCSSCVYLIFTYQANLLIASGVDPSLHSNCHHQIIYSKFDSQIFYPPPYLREVWHYKDRKTELIRRPIAVFDWEKTFSNISVDEKAVIFNRTILNILNNYIPHETIVCNDRDPPWFNDKIRLLIKEKMTTYKYFPQSGNDAYWKYYLKVLQDRLNNTSSRPEVFRNKGVLKNFAKFTGKHLCQSLIFNLIKKETLAQVFSCEFVKFLRAPISIEHLWLLLLK